MAVARYGENKETLQAEPGDRLRAADFSQGGEMIGKAIQGFGAAVGDAAKAADTIAAKHDEAAVRQADAADALEILKIKQQALAAQGTNAQAAVEQANKDIAEVGRRRQESFSTNRQRTMYADVFSRRSLGASEALGGHALQQVEVAHKASLDASIDSGTEVAVRSYAEPKEFKRNMDAVDVAIEGKYAGMPANVVARAKQIVRSNVHANVVQTILNDPDKITDAAIYLRDHASEIDAETETKLYKMVNPFLDEERTATDAGWAMSGAPAPTSEHVDEDPPAPVADPLAPAATPEAAAPVAPRAPAAPAKFVDPLRGRGTRISGFHASRPGGRQHAAQDIAAPAGTPIYPPMSGKVKKSWWDEDGGWSVLIEHPNGYVTGYAHLKSKSAFSEGDEVDRSTMIGGVGNTGAGSRGNHLHFTVRKAGAKVDPTKVIGSTVNGEAPGTIDPKGVAWKEDKLPDYAAEDTNVASALGRLHQRATAEGWSSRRYEQAAKEVRSRGAVNQSLYADANRRLEDNVWGKFAAAEEAGSPVTSISQLGPDFARLDGRSKATVLNMIDANKKALAKPEGEGVPANGDSYTELAIAARDPGQRAAFLAQNLDAVPDITPGERTRLKLQQQNLRNDGNGTLAADLDGLRSVVNRYAPEGGFGTPAKAGTAAFKENRRRQALLLDRTTALVDQRQKQLGRPLTDVEKDGIVRSQVVAIARGGKEMPLYIARTTPKKAGEVDSVDAPATFNNIPTLAKQSIMRALQRQGIPVTPRNIIEAYLEGSR